ncbi:unnamed protein product, partial [Allacma fusca]
NWIEKILWIFDLLMEVQANSAEDSPSQGSSEPQSRNLRPTSNTP